MSKKVKFGDIFQPGDILVILVIAAGILIAVFLEGIAFKLIGICISILGLLAMAMLISQRLSDIVESKKFNLANKQNFQMTIVKDSSAKRQTVENFDSTFGESSDSGNNIDVTMGADEGFRIVSKSTRATSQKNEDIAKSNLSAQEPPQVTIPMPIENEEVMHIDNTSKDVFNEPQSVQTEAFEEIEAVDTSDSINHEEQGLIQPYPEEKTKIDYAASTDHILEPEIIVQPEQIRSEEIEETGEQITENIEEELPEMLDEINEITPEPEKIEELMETLPHQTYEVEDEIAEQEEPIEPEDTAASEQIPQESELEEIIEEKIEEPINEEPCKKKLTEVPFSLLMDDEPLGAEPRKEFEFFISRALLIIRSVISTRTTAFMLVNAEKNQFILESYITSVPDAIIEDIKITISNDIISQIIKSGKPEILTEINPSAELDLIPYYSAATGTSSFIGMPVFFGKQVIGIIACDTNEKNAYDASTVSFIGHFSKLLSGLVQSYTEKYDLLQADKAIKAMSKFSELSTNIGVDNIKIAQALLDTLSEMYDIHTAGVCLFDENRNGWYIVAANTFSDMPYLKKEPIDLSNSMIGDAIIHSQSIVEMPISSQKARINHKEIPLSGGYFIAVPIRSDMHTYGAMFIEGTSHSAINNFDLTVLETLSNGAGNSIERINLMKMLQTSSIIDTDTGLMNNVALYNRIQEEIARVRDYKSLASLCLVSIDKYAAFDEMEESNNYEKINYHCISMINKSLKEYDIFGRIEPGIFAIVLVGQAADKAKLWAERIRNAAAISVVEIDHRRFTVTLSMGIAQISPATNLNELLENTGKALGIAMHKTNCVQVF